MKIGIFDSGHGGRFVAEKLKVFMPDHEYIVVDDAKNAPYGERSQANVKQLTHAAIQPILDNSDIVVLACNTATAAAIDSLRLKYPEKIFVGFEPMIKTANQVSRTGHITLLATQATADSRRTANLIKSYGQDLRIDKPSTIGWAAAIDSRQADSIDLDSVARSIASGSDTIVVACTHYIELIPSLKALKPNITILEPTQAVAQRVSQLAAAQPL